MTASQTARCEHTSAIFAAHHVFGFRTFSLLCKLCDDRKAGMPHHRCSNSSCGQRRTLVVTDLWQLYWPKKKKKKNCSEMKCRALPEIYPPPRWWSVDNVKLWSIWPAALPKLLALKYYAHFKMPPLVCCLVPYVALRTHSQRPNEIHCAAALHVNAFRKFIASGFNGH